MRTYQDVLTRFRAAIEAQDLSYEDIARALGRRGGDWKPSKQWVNYALGKQEREPSIEKLHLIAEALGLRLDVRLSSAAAPERPVTLPEDLAGPAELLRLTEGKRRELIGTLLRTLPTVTLSVLQSMVTIGADHSTPEVALDDERTG